MAHADTHSSDAGDINLQRVSHLSRYNAWLWEQVAPYVGKRVLEVGSGIGTMTQFCLDRELVVATDITSEHLECLQTTFAHQPNVLVRFLDLNVPLPDWLVEQRIDTVLCTNVLEHIEDDDTLISHFSQVLPVHGRVVLIIPALRSLYGEMDRAIDHYRRYEKTEIIAKLERAHFTVETTTFFNLIGVPGWDLNS